MIEAQVIKIEDTHVVLQLANGDEINLVKNYLPDNIKVGEKLIIEISTWENYQSKQNQTAREVLNEIMTHE